MSLPVRFHNVVRRYSLSRSNHDSERIHVWHEIESMYHRILARDKTLAPPPNDPLPTPNPPAATLAHSPAGENGTEHHHMERDHATEFAVEKRYADSSTSTAEDRSMLKASGAVQGVPLADGAHASELGVEVNEESGCPRILESFSLSEGCYRLMPSQRILQEDKCTEDAKVGASSVQRAIHHTLRVPCVVKTDERWYEQFPIQRVVNIHPFGVTSFSDEQPVTAEDTQGELEETVSSTDANFNGGGTSFQIEEPARREGYAAPRVEPSVLQSCLSESNHTRLGGVPFCSRLEVLKGNNATTMLERSAAGKFAVKTEPTPQVQLQAEYSQPSRPRETSSKGTATSFCSRIEGPREGSENGMLGCSVAGQFAVKEERMEEPLQSSFPPLNLSSKTPSHTEVGAFLALDEESKVGSGTEEPKNSTFVAQVAVKQEPRDEQELARFPDENTAFGINCENNGTEITLTFCQTEDKGTQYQAEDIGLWPAGPGSARSLEGGRLVLSLSSNGYDLPKAEERSTGPRTSCPAATAEKETGFSQPVFLRHEVKESRPAMGSAFTVSPDDDAFQGKCSTIRISGDDPPRENRISQLKHLLEKQEKDLEKMRSERNWSSHFSTMAEKLVEAMDALEEDSTSRDGNDRAAASNQETPHTQHTTGVAELCPGQNVGRGASECHEVLEEAIRSEMARQSRTSKGKRRGECFAYLDSKGVVVFGRKVVRKKQPGSSNRLEKLIFRLRNSLSRKKLISERKSRSLAQPRKNSPREPVPDQAAFSQSCARDKPSAEHAINADARGAVPSEPRGTDANLLTKDLKGTKRRQNPGQNDKPALVDAKRAYTPRLINKQDEFLAEFGLTRKTLDFVTGRFSALYGGPRRRLPDDEIQPTDCRDMRLGPQFEYRGGQGWFLAITEKSMGGLGAVRGLGTS